ncbi:unnamed protein product [Lymnaea stagnalis]|uniref:Ig-like domain-containing protein n=1 Tax=Lymnaea stagnalis TaxID=6523 RepID=A0AAV2H6Z0_LYMST
MYVLNNESMIVRLNINTYNLKKHGRILAALQRVFISKMASLPVFIPLFFVFISAVECQNTCLLKYPNAINLKCDVKDQDATNLTWSLFDTESNKTLIINICEATICHPLIPKLADALFLASVTSDDTGRFIKSSTLKADVKYADLTKLSNYRQLQCQYEDKIITVCDSFDVHVNPTKLTVYEIDILNHGDEFDIIVQTDTLFPLPECTLYVDNIAVQVNSSILINQEFDLTFDYVYSNPEDQFDYVFPYYGLCVFELNVTELGHGFHQLQIKASAKTSDKDRDDVTTDLMSINFDWPKESVPVCNYPEVVKNNVILTCRSGVLISSVGWEFEIRTNGTSLRVLYSKKITVKYADLLGVPKLVTESQTTWNTNDLGPGYHEFRVSLVTNDTMGNVSKLPSPYTTPLTLSNVIVPGCIYQEVSEKAVIISCRENLTSEAVNCTYQIITNGTMRQVKGETNFYQHATHLNAISECNLTVNPRDLALGYHQFRISLLTNDTNGNLTEKHFDTTSPLHFYLPVVNSRLDIDVDGSDGFGNCTCHLKSVGNPPGSVHWTWVMSNGSLYNGAPGNNVIMYSSKNLVENKNFSCQPLSVLMDNLPMLYANLVVNQKQKLLNFTANGEEQKLVVDIGSYVTLECLASGYPTPDVQFHQVGKDGSITTKSRFYTFEISSCLDGGRYVCSIKQRSAYQTLESTIEIIVTCPLLIRNAVEYPRQFDTGGKHNLDIMIPVYGYPEPSHYTLLRQSSNQIVVVTSGYSASYRLDDNPYGTIVLSFADVQDDYFTNYTLVFGNGMGSDQEYRFYLTNADEPEGSDDNVGAIVGGVCGGVAAVVLIIFIIYFVNRSRKHKNMQSMDSNKYIFTNDRNSAKQ